MSSTSTDAAASPNGRPQGSLLTSVAAGLRILARGRVRGRLAEWSSLVAEVAAWEPRLQPLSNDELRKRSLSLRYRAKSREPLDARCCPRRLPWCARRPRTLGMRHFDVQMLGGIAHAPSLDRRNANRRRQNADRHAAAVSEGADRQGRPCWPR